MHGLPKGTDVSFLRETLLTQVCVGRHEVILHLLPPDPWSPPISITIEASVRLVAPSGEDLATEEPLEIAPVLLPLLGSTLSKVSILLPGTLRLTWSTGHVLDVIDSHDHYDSYTITNGDHVIAV
jgi:hypothetical protein